MGTNSSRPLWRKPREVRDCGRCISRNSSALELVVSSSKLLKRQSSAVLRAVVEAVIRLLCYHKINLNDTEKGFVIHAYRHHRFRQPRGRRTLCRLGQGLAGGRPRRAAGDPSGLRIARHVARAGVLARRGQRAGHRAKQHGGADRERELPRHPVADGQGGPTRRAGAWPGAVWRLARAWIWCSQASAGCSWALPWRRSWGCRSCRRTTSPSRPRAPIPAFVVPRPPAWLGGAAESPVLSACPADDVAGVPVGR